MALSDSKLDKLTSAIGELISGQAKSDASSAKNQDSFLKDLGSGLKEGVVNLKDRFVSGSGARQNREQFLQTSKVVMSEFGDQALFQIRNIVADLGKDEDEDELAPKKKRSWFSIIMDVFKKVLAPLLIAAVGGASILLGMFGDGPLQGAGQVLGRILSTGKVWELLTKILPGRIGEWFTKLFSGTIDDLVRVLTSSTGVIGKHIVPYLANLFPRLAGIATNLFKTVAPALKGVPLIGPLISFGFAVFDFKKGDYIGGIINLVAGITGLIPGPLGIILPIGLSVFNLFLDFKMGTEGKKEWGKKHMGFLGALGKVSVWVAKLLKPTLKFLPVIGALLDFGFAYSRFKRGDFVGGMIDLTAGIFSLIPGAGLPISIGLSLLNELLDNTNAGKKTKDFLGKGGTGLFKVILKWGTKLGMTLLKVAKFIPFVGGFIGIGFAIYRFKQGQYIRGFLELVSGIADFIPGAGNIVSAAIDGVLLVADLLLMKHDAKKRREGKNKFSWSAIGKFVMDAFLMQPFIFPFYMAYKAFKILQEGGPVGEAFVKLAYALPFFGTLAGLFGLPKTPEAAIQKGLGIKFEKVYSKIPVIREMIFGAKGVMALMKGDVKEGLKNIAFMVPGIQPLYNLFASKTSELRAFATANDLSIKQALAVSMGRKVLSWVPKLFRGKVAKYMGLAMGVDPALLTREKDNEVAENFGGAASDALADADEHLNSGSKSIADRAKRIMRTGRGFTKGSPYADEVLEEAGKSINVRVKKLSTSADVTLSSIFSNVIRSFMGLGTKANDALDKDIKARAPKSDLVSIAQQQLEVQKSIASDLRALVTQAVNARTRKQFAPEKIKDADTDTDLLTKEMALGIERDRQYAEQTDKAAKSQEEKQKGLWGNVQELVSKVTNPSISVKAEVDLGDGVENIVKAQRDVHGALTHVDAPILQALKNIDTTLKGLNVGSTTVLPVPAGNNTNRGTQYPQTPHGNARGERRGR